MACLKLSIVKFMSVFYMPVRLGLSSTLITGTSPCGSNNPKFAHRNIAKTCKPEVGGYKCINTTSVCLSNITYFYVNYQIYIYVLRCYISK